MKLAELQSLFQKNVLDEAPSPEFLRQLRPPVRAERIEDTFAVYHDGFRLRMAEFLANDYPSLRAALGDEAFEEIAIAYMAARPSRFRNARWFGAALPDFLRATPPFAQDRFACGLAALEAALARSFDAADETPLAMEILGVTPEQDWPLLRFAFHPGVVLVEAPAAALAAYEAVQRGEEEADLSEIADEDLTLLVWREELEVHYRALDELEALALREARAGKPFGEICALLAFARPDEAAENLTALAARLLVGWFGAGMIVAAQAK